MTATNSFGSIQKICSCVRPLYLTHSKKKRHEQHRIVKSMSIIFSYCTKGGGKEIMFSLKECLEPPPIALHGVCPVASTKSQLVSRKEAQCAGWPWVINISLFYKVLFLIEHINLFYEWDESDWMIKAVCFSKIRITKTCNGGEIAAIVSDVPMFRCGFGIDKLNWLTIFISVLLCSTV